MVSKKVYDPKKLEAKWQKEWKNSRLYEVDIEKAKKPFYNLMMFPYPSAEGLHVGNMYAFTGADVYGRFQRMQGQDVLEPIGLDGFGIHSENYAIKIGKHPAQQAKVSQENFYRQLSMIGNGFSWENKLETYDPIYYRWTQWIFVQMFKNGLAYKKESWVNWCPACKTVLADEQVENSKCERCKNEVTRKEISAWHFKITDYAEKLLANIEKIDWPVGIKSAQREWIGRREGAKIRFQLSVDSGQDYVEVFTSRLDTIFGVSFLVVAPEVAKQWMGTGWKANEEVRRYIEKALNRTEQARKEAEKEKTGVKLDLVAVNPASGEEVPVFVADYVLMDVGTGVVMGVPAHDQRDWEFAKKYGLEVRPVVKPSDATLDPSYAQDDDKVFVEDGVVVNSGKYDGLGSAEAREKILGDLEKEGKAEKMVNYHLRDWVISRQRYWGPPIPIIYCRKCWENQELRIKNQGFGQVVEREGKKYMAYSVDESDLPVILPEVSDYQPKGDGSSPLSNAPDEWKKTKCSKCGGEAERELDVSDTFLDSSWYYLAYPHMDDGQWSELSDQSSPFDKEVLKKWLPVNAYIGGAEHAVLHLLYARFVNQALNDWGYVEFEEPFPFLFSHGLIVKDGSKMSKSKGNVVNPDEYIERYGADALRAYLMFLGSYEQGGDFRDTGMAGMYRWLERVWKLVGNEEKRAEKSSDKAEKKLNKTIKKVGEDLGKFSYNTAIAVMMEMVNVWREEGEVLSQADMKRFVQIMAPVVPHMTEELWEVLGGEGSVHVSKWPEYEEVGESEVTMAVQVNGKMRATLVVGVDEAKDEGRVVEMALAEEKVSKWVGEKKPKVIFVPGRVVNLVV